MSSSPTTPNGMILAPNLDATLTNSGCSGQNNLYSSPCKAPLSLHVSLLPYNLQREREKVTISMRKRKPPCYAKLRGHHQDTKAHETLNAVV